MKDNSESQISILLLMAKSMILSATRKTKVEGFRQEIIITLIGI